MRNGRFVLTTLFLTLLLTGTASAEALTVERILSAPNLSGPLPKAVKLSPDGSRVTFLMARETDRSRYDLWEHDVDSGNRRMLVDSDLLGGTEELPDEEKARRERMRIAGRTGIVQYFWADQGDRLLIPIGGDLFVYDLEAKREEAVRRITSTPEFELDPQFSPGGRYVSYLRNQDLYAYDLAEGSELRLTEGGDGSVTFGAAEFVAQEEMGRYTGYWWAPDDSRIAFTRVDDTPVEIMRRFEVRADSIDVVEQRYPRAGTANAVVDLFVRDMAGGESRQVDLGEEADIYVYRVAWFPDGRHLAVQRQPRSLDRLDLLKIDAATGGGRVLLSERSPTWLERGERLFFLEETREMIWTSRAGGYEHLFLYDQDGKPIRRLTGGDWEVVGIRGQPRVVGIDEKSRTVYFTSTAESVMERHLYSQSLDGSDPATIRKVTGRPGFHRIVFSDDASVYVDTFSSTEQPPQVSLHRPDGKRIAWLEENRLDETHPYFPYLDHHVYPEFGTLKAEDGVILHYRIHKPSGFDPGRRYPALVYVYGGPGGQEVRNVWGREFDHWLNHLAQRGYVVFTLDNRGTGYRGRAFDAPIHRRLGDVEVRDQVLGAEFLASRPWVDRSRIGVFGWSYGGYMALLLPMKAPGLFASAVSGAPVTDWALYDTYYTEMYMGHPKDNAGGYEAASVFPYLESLEADLLLVHGMADDNVLFTHTTKLMKNLQDLQKPFDLMTYPGSRHTLFRMRGPGEHCMNTVNRFLDRTLKSRPGPGESSPTR